MPVTDAARPNLTGLEKTFVTLIEQALADREPYKLLALFDMFERLRAVYQGPTEHLRFEIELAQRKASFTGDLFAGIPDRPTVH